MTDIGGGIEPRQPSDKVTESGDTDEAFDVYLPFDAGGDPARATHVAHMRGDRDQLTEILAGFVATGSDLSAPLRERGGSTPDEMRFALDGLGPARVESVEALQR